MNLQEYFNVRIDIINEALLKILPDEKVEPSELHAAMRYSIFAGGKRLRPVLFIAASEALDSNWKPYLPYACAVEMIHTYSLIHDDLPCMDDDDLRRGRATCHKVYGEATALLAGDALLTAAFAILPDIQAHPQGVLSALRLLGNSAGSMGMVGGQVLDLASEGKRISPELMQTIHANKTGALFSAAIVGAAALSCADEKKTKSLQNYANKLGVAFQIVDDILDIVGEEALIGKPVGSDEKNLKATYPALFGLENSRKMAQDTIEQAIEAVEIFGDKGQALKEIALFILNRNH